jgi:hypothetical protein
MDRTVVAVFHAAVVASALCWLGGCSDARVSAIAREAADRQAQQNLEMAKLNREVAEGSKRLVSLQQDLRSDQAEVVEGFNALESERRAMAAHRHRAPIIANAITGVGLTIACVLPLLLCWYLLRDVHDEQNDPVVTEILIEELGTGRTMLLPPFAGDRSAIECHDRQRSLLPAAGDHGTEQEPADM